MTTSSETLASTRPAHDATSARPAWRWAALLLQIEVLGALAITLIGLRNAAPPINPAPVLFAILAATILMPLGSAIERGSHAAGLLLVGMYVLRALQALTAPPDVLLKMAPLLVIEGFVFGRAVFTMTKFPAVPAPPRTLLITVLPILVTFALIPSMSVRSARDCVVVGALMGMILIALHRAPRRILRAFGRPELVVPKRQFHVALKRPPLFVIDITIGVLTIGGSLFVLTWFFEAASAPGAMLSPGVLIVPLLALVYVPLGFVWIGVGIAEWKKKQWAGKLRIAASVPLFLFLIMTGPTALKALLFYLKTLIAA